MPGNFDVVNDTGKSTHGFEIDRTTPRPVSWDAGNGGPVGPNAASILRRHELLEYAGPYDDETHAAKPWGNDSNPDPGDIGTYIGAQNGALNLNGAAIPDPET